LLLLLSVVAPARPAVAASPPSIASVWATDVLASSARLHGEMNPNGAVTSYHFEYIQAAAYEANLGLGKDGFAGAAKAPPGIDPIVSGGTSVVQLPPQQITGLSPETGYRYRLVVKNSFGTTNGSALQIKTQAFASGGLLPDARGWEMVSPIDKNGGQVDPPETIAGGGVYQAAAAGGALTYSSAASFGQDAAGAAQGSQYLARRASGGWQSTNITQPMLSGSYGSGLVGVPYEIFSPDLARAVLLNGRHCRDGGSDCPVANPPLPGTAAPAGFQNYYLLEGGGFSAVVGGGDLTHSSLQASQFFFTLVGAGDDLHHLVFASCGALTFSAVEVPDAGGCDPAATNLYAWDGSDLRQVNLLPGAAVGTTGAALAAPMGAISADGNRVYFYLGGDLYLREGESTVQVDEAAAGGGTFQTAAADGSVAYFTRGDHLWRFLAATGEATDLTPSGEVEGVVGASADGDVVYYLSLTGLQRWQGGSSASVTGSVDSSNFPPATGSARVSADGERLVFSSTAPLTGYDNTDQGTGKPVAELYLYEAPTNTLRCISCNPTGGRPIGASGIPGALANGALPDSFRAYRPRALVLGGRRIFFESGDALALGDTNEQQDVFQWEADGTGGCQKEGGCLALISSGKDPRPSYFLDASMDGSDVYFLTARSLVAGDLGAYDAYDARVGGGFPVPSKPIPCEGDACQPLPTAAQEPAVGTLVAGPGNPPVHYKRLNGRKKKHHRHPHKKHRGSKHGKAKAQQRGRWMVAR
jgi:hypothetical protein